MIDQDYAELLNRSPPSGDVLEWTFSTRTLANFVATLLLGTPALCFALYYALAGEEDPRNGASLRVSGFFVFVSTVSRSDGKRRPVCTGKCVTMQHVLYIHGAWSGFVTDIYLVGWLFRSKHLVLALGTDN